MEPLVTPEAFSAWTGGRVPVSDPRLAPLLEGATRAVRRYCGWHIAPLLPETLTIDGTGGRLLTIPTLRMTNVDEVKVLGDVLPTDAYDWSELGNIELRHGRWPRRFRSITAKVEHGFDTAPDVAQIIMQVCAAAISSPMGATREQAGQVSVTWGLTAPNTAGGMSLLQRDLEILDLYRVERGP